MYHILGYPFPCARLTCVATHTRGARLRLCCPDEDSHEVPGHPSFPVLVQALHFDAQGAHSAAAVQVRRQRRGSRRGQIRRKGDRGRRGNRLKIKGRWMCSFALPTQYQAYSQERCLEASYLLFRYIKSKSDTP